MSRTRVYEARLTRLPGCREYTVGEMVKVVGAESFSEYEDQLDGTWLLLPEQEEPTMHNRPAGCRVYALAAEPGEEPFAVAVERDLDPNTMTHDERAEILESILDEVVCDRGVGALLTEIPGFAEAALEHYNNEIIDEWIERN